MITYHPDKKKWDSLLKRNKSSIFQTIEWANCLFGTPIYIINEVKGKYVGGMVLIQRPDKRAYDSMLGGGYGGYIGEPVDFSNLITPSIYYIRVVDYNNTFKEKWEKKKVSTYIIDLKDYKLSHGVKDNIRVAKKNGVTIEKTEDIDEFYKIYTECYKNFNTDTYDKDYFIKIKENLKEMAEFYLMKIGNKSIGISLQLLYKDEIFNLYNACLNEYKNTGCISLMMSKMTERNYRYYNLGAATTEGSHNFKSNWGAVKYDYNIYGKIINFQYKYA